MTTLHLSEVNGLAVMPREEFDKLLELARRSEEVAVEVQKMPLEDELPSIREMSVLTLRDSGWRWLRDVPDSYSRFDADPL